MTDQCDGRSAADRRARPDYGVREASGARHDSRALFRHPAARCNVARPISSFFATPVTAQLPPYDIAAWRARIPILEHAVPMNNCSQAPLTDATQAAVDAYLRSWARDGMDWDAWMAEVERARQSFARLINADVDDGTSSG